MIQDEVWRILRERARTARRAKNEEAFSVKKKNPYRANRRNIERQSRSRSGAPQTKIPEKITTPVHQRIWRMISWILGPPLALLAAIYTFLGPPWPTEPTFSPGASSFGSALDVPFILTNKSAFFRITSLAIACHVHIEAKGSSGAVISTAPGVFATIAAQGINSAIEPGSVAPFTCPIRGLMRIDDKDAADAITSAQIFFTTQYDVRLFGRSQRQSNLFTLDKRTVPPQWVPGEPLK